MGYIDSGAWNHDRYSVGGLMNRRNFLKASSLAIALPTIPVMATSRIQGQSATCVIIDEWPVPDRLAREAYLRMLKRTMAIPGVCVLLEDTIYSDMPFSSLKTHILPQIKDKKQLVHKSSVFSHTPA